MHSAELVEDLGPREEGEFFTLLQGMHEDKKSLLALEPLLF